MKKRIPVQKLEFDCFQVSDEEEYSESPVLEDNNDLKETKIVTKSLEEEIYFLRLYYTSTHALWHEIQVRKTENYRLPLTKNLMICGKKA